MSKEAMESILESSSFPQELIRSDDEVAELRQQIAEQKEAEKAAALAIEAAKAVPGLSKKVEPDSPLAAIAEQAA